MFSKISLFFVFFYFYPFHCRLFDLLPQEKQKFYYGLVARRHLGSG